jgi:GTP-binding protein LepA
MADKSTDLSRIRNFSIIAHIDHGKSTLADRLIHMCGGLSDREMTEQVLDSMDLEKERGITIKAQSVRLNYQALDGHTYQLNIMDTPGHVDFSYEVSRSMAAVEGSLLIVDATQGVEAQTLANVYQAIEKDHEIIPVINKIDLPAADVDRVKQQIEDVIGLDASGAIGISAKTGENVDLLLEAIVEQLPAPKIDDQVNHDVTRAMVIDSWYDTYLGVIVLVRVRSGSLNLGDEIQFMATGAKAEIDRVGVYSPKPVEIDHLGTGQVGFITAGIKDISKTRVGDTITGQTSAAEDPLPGFEPSVPVVFSSLFPVDTSDLEHLRDSIGKLALNDASFHYEAETSAALGVGFRCGFLGLLHMEIIQERLSREFDLELIATAPSVVYHVHKTDGEMLELYNPADLPDPSVIDRIEEPWIKATIMLPDEHLGGVLQLCEQRRGEQVTLTYAGDRAMIVYKLPLNEVVFDFYDRLKSISRGYASFDYERIGYREEDLVKMTILVNKEEVDALSQIIHRSQAEYRGRRLCEKLKDLIPKQLFKIPVQAAIGGKVIARETIGAMRKDVTAKCYGGDISRKKKLREQQKKGKKKMRQYGSVDIPQEAFIEVLKIGDE